MTKTTNDYITVSVAATKGSAPRGAGATMTIYAEGQNGSIGGGALEWEATLIAREMLASDKTEAKRTFPLGPDLGQCCGGQVTLTFQRNQHQTSAFTTPLFIWGAGHVGRAIAALVAPLEDREITLIDVAAERFPDPLDTRIMPLVAADPVRAVRHTPHDADHLILTYSHDLDLALCDGLLHHGFHTCGLIGSATKWARFRTRLASMGHGSDQIARITCPIGNPALGKHPQAIAVGVVAGLLYASATDAATQFVMGDDT